MHCAVARALEILGERWTLLVVRELLTGPKRYADLVEGLPGIASNMLTDRLRSLTDAGVVNQRKLPPPAGSTVYDLTERGRQLKPVLLALGHWGMPLLGGEPRPGEQFRLAWLMIALDGQYQPSHVPTPIKIVLKVGNEAVTITAHGSEHTVSEGSDGQADITVAASQDTFLAWIAGHLTDRQAVTAGMKADGVAGGLRQLRAMYQAQ